MGLCCPAVVLVKDSVGALSPPLSVRTTIVTKVRNKGRPKENGLGGLGARQVSPPVVPVRTSDDEYLDGLPDGALHKVCSLFRVKTLKTRATGAKRVKKSKRRLPRPVLLSGLRERLIRNKTRGSSVSMAEFGEMESDSDCDTDDEMIESSIGNAANSIGKRKRQSERED